MHGILDSYKSMDDLIAFINAAHPSTDIYNIDAYNDIVSRDYPLSMLVFKPYYRNQTILVVYVCVCVCVCVCTGKL